MGLYLNGKLVGISLPQQNSGGGDIIIATNNTGSAISAGDKVWINKDGSNYIIKDFLSFDQSLVNTKGSLIFSNGNASGFSTSNYISVGFLPMSTFSSWSFEMEFTTGNSFGESSQALFIEDNTGWNSGINIGGGKDIYVGLSSAHSGNDIGFMATTTKLSTNTTYKVKLEFTGSAYNLYLNNILENTITSSIKLSNHIWNIGCSNTSGYEYVFLGSANLKKTKFIAGGYVWSPNKTISQDAFSAIAAEDIAISDSGQVKTVLPE